MKVKTQYIKNLCDTTIAVVRSKCTSISPTLRNQRYLINNLMTHFSAIQTESWETKK